MFMHLHYIYIYIYTCVVETSNLTFTETHPRMGISPVSSVYPSEHSPTLSSVVTNYNVIVAEQTINTSNHLSSEIILASFFNNFDFFFLTNFEHTFNMYLSFVSFIQNF
jgi:hypothetical protein